MLEDPWLIFGSNMAEVIRKNVDSFKTMLARAGATRKCMVEVYRAAVKWDQILSIEKLPPEQKLKYWEEAKELAAGKGLSQEHVIEISKVIYLID